MNDIIAFIERAIKENLNIRTTHREWSSNFEEYVINIYNSDEELFVIQYLHEGSSNKKNNVIQISKGLLDWVDIEVSEMDIALFKVEILKAEKYSKNKVIEAFNNFFEEDNSKPTTIDDLDNDEE
jgi:hypothetical protein